MFICLLRWRWDLIAREFLRISFHHLKVNARDARADAQLASFYSSELLSIYEHLCQSNMFFLTFFECSFFYSFARRRRRRISFHLYLWCNRFCYFLFIYLKEWTNGFAELWRWPVAFCPSLSACYGTWLYSLFFYTGAFELAPSAINLFAEIIQIRYKTGRTLKKTDVFDFNSIIDDVIFVGTFGHVIKLIIKRDRSWPHRMTTLWLHIRLRVFM